MLAGGQPAWTVDVELTCASFFRRGSDNGPGQLGELDQRRLSSVSRLNAWLSNSPLSCCLSGVYGSLWNQLEHAK